jgi:hypothetical protein
VAHHPCDVRLRPDGALRPGVQPRRRGAVRRAGAPGTGRQLPHGAGPAHRGLRRYGDEQSLQRHPDAHVVRHAVHPEPHRPDGGERADAAARRAHR